MKNTRDYHKLLMADTEEAEILLENKEINVDASNDYGKTALFSSDLKKSKILIKYGADVNHKSNNGSTPLLCTLNCDKFIFLLDNGADINVSNNTNQSLIFKENIIEEVGPSEYIKILKKYNFNFTGIEEKQTRLSEVLDLNVWKEIINQNCIDEIPNFRFIETENVRKNYQHWFEKKNLLFIQNFELYPEIIEFLFDVKEEMFGFVLSKYNYDLDFLKHNYSSEVHPIFDKEMLKFKIKKEKEKIIFSMNENVECSPNRSKRL